MGEWASKIYFFIAVAIMAFLFLTTMFRAWKKRDKGDKKKEDLLEENIIY